MNKEAVALATDSAATMTDQKIFTSANKLFALSKYHPVGIMVYGAAHFMGVPWETIIKIYREGLAAKGFRGLREYCDDFILFLSRTVDNRLFPDSVQEAYLRSTIYGYFGFLRGLVQDHVRRAIEQKGAIGDSEVAQAILDIVREHHEKWDRASFATGIDETHARAIVTKYKETIDKAVREIFEKLPLASESLSQLTSIAGNLFCKFPEGVQKRDISGIVIAGFGEDEIFPSLESFFPEGIALDKLKYRPHISRRVDFGAESAIVAFAQTEMVATFMEGVDPSYRNLEEAYLSELFQAYAERIVATIKKYDNAEKEALKEALGKINQEILKEHKDRLEQYCKDQCSRPIARVISVLPKDELAAVAESLINLTSFKRRVTMESETVGGPIDVAVISKGDGFIWIKRKHYFEPGLNPRFMARSYKEV